MTSHAISCQLDSHKSPDRVEAMSESQNTSESTPWHLWVIGVVSLLWSAMGAMDYLMTQTRNEAYMSSFSPEQIAYFYSFPTWVVSAWALAVWGGVLGAVLLLTRRRFAVPVYLVSLIALCTSNLYIYALSDGLKIIGDAFSIGFTVLIFVVAMALFFYARTMRRRGVLI